MNRKEEILKELLSSFLIGKLPENDLINTIYQAMEIYATEVATEFAEWVHGYCVHHNEKDLWTLFGDEGEYPKQLNTAQLFEAFKQQKDNLKNNNHDSTRESKGVGAETSKTSSIFNKR